MRSYVELKQILELWEQGLPKKRISIETGIPLTTVRHCIERYGSVQCLGEIMSGKVTQPDKLIRGRMQRQ